MFEDPFEKLCSSIGILFSSRGQARAGRRGRQTMAHAIPPVARHHEAARPPRLRLTRRGRIVLIVIPLSLLALAVLALWAALMAPAHASDEQLAGPGQAVTVTVRPGESLWTIAARTAPGQDPRVTIGQIRELNDLGGSRVVPGEQLLVPVAG